MKKEIATGWIDTLHSGKYLQGKHYLKQSAGDATLHCCLGVLCELYKESNEKIDEKNIWDSSQVKLHTFDGSTGTLPDIVKEWAGMSSHNGDLGSSSLADMNDAGISFSDIAHAISTHWMEL